jgi:hypothetical protein
VGTGEQLERRRGAGLSGIRFVIRDAEQRQRPRRREVAVVPGSRTGRHCQLRQAVRVDGERGQRRLRQRVTLLLNPWRRIRARPASFAHLHAPILGGDSGRPHRATPRPKQRLVRARLASFAHFHAPILGEDSGRRNRATPPPKQRLVRARPVSFAYLHVAVLGGDSWRQHRITLLLLMHLRVHLHGHLERAVRPPPIGEGVLRQPFRLRARHAGAPLQQHLREPRRHDEHPIGALVVERRVGEGPALRGRAAGGADERGSAPRGGGQAGEVRDGFAADVAGGDGGVRGDERVVRLVEGPLRGKGDEEEAGAAVVRAVGEEDAGVAEPGAHAAPVHAVERPGAHGGGAAVALAAVGLLLEWPGPGGRRIHRWYHA